MNNIKKSSWLHSGIFECLREKEKVSRFISWRGQGF